MLKVIATGKGALSGEATAWEGRSPPGQRLGAALPVAGNAGHATTCECTEPFLHR